MILAIDPGPETSGWVLYDFMAKQIHTGYPATPNKAILPLIETEILCAPPPLVAIEWIQSYGMAVGASVFETCFWAGRFAQAAGDIRTTRITRPEIKLHLCGATRAKDANVRQALIDRFGGAGGKRAAIGLKASPGPLYGCRSHMWAALALAVTWTDRDGQGGTAGEPGGIVGELRGNG